MQITQKCYLIDCVMCTFNGSKYILEQLESIINQTYQVDRLIICDDCSSDETVELIRKWSNKTDVKVELYVNETSIGAKKNFEKALSKTDGDYIFFADQDDIWMSDKIELSIKKIKTMEEEYGEDMPCLVHSDLMVVNEKAQPIHKSFMKYQGINHVFDENKLLPNLMVQNFVTGCTVVINRALKEKSLPFPENVIMHDYWLALLAAMVGKMGYVDKATLLYRQHDYNTIGAVRYLSLKNVFRACNVKKRLAGIDANIEQLRSVICYKDGELMANDKCKCITLFLKNIDEKNYLRIILSRVYKQGWLLNLLFRFYMIRYMAKR